MDNVTATRRRKIASPKQWQSIIADKGKVCRVGEAGRAFPLDCYGQTQYHHLVTREDHGDDVPANIIPLCQKHHDLVTGRDRATCRLLLSELYADEYAYMVERGGSDYAERVYGIEYVR